MKFCFSFERPFMYSNIFLPSIWAEVMILMTKTLVGFISLWNSERGISFLQNYCQSERILDTEKTTSDCVDNDDWLSKLSRFWLGTWNCKSMKTFLNVSFSTAHILSFLSAILITLSLWSTFTVHCSLFLVFVCLLFSKENARVWMRRNEHMIVIKMKKQKTKCIADRKNEFYFMLFIECWKKNYYDNHTIKKKVLNSENREKCRVDRQTVKC